MKQKHFMDIQRIKEEDSELSISNINGFKKGDHIVIQEKVDGSNASFRYDEETNMLIAFSRKQELSYNKTLNGFWNYIQSFDPYKYKDEARYVFFGEWLVKNAIKYKPEAYHKWYVYDIYDMVEQKYLLQSEVKDACKRHGWIYVNTLYDGPFISWEHCKTFVGKSDIALDLGEGIVVKNQSELNSEDNRLPFVLKIVGNNFSEIKKSNHRKKEVDPLKKQQKELLLEFTRQIVTKRRVEKELFKMRDEGLLPEKIAPQDMKIVAQNLPKRIFYDCIKEEKETVDLIGESFGKMSCSVAMDYARRIILSDEQQEIE